MANEVVDKVRRLKKEMLFFKVDFEKAYDSVDLKYLDDVMKKMNFSTLWRKWMSECVSVVLQHVDTACVGGCSCMESAVHLFLLCNLFGSLWHLIYQWVDISFITPTSIADHFHHFGQSAGLPRSAHSYLQLIWHTSVQVIWKERNNMFFQNKAHEI